VGRATKLERIVVVAILQQAAPYSSKGIGDFIGLV
jgi:hypothetical protein